MEDLKSKLGLIGLSPNEIKAYLTLITFGGLTALELSEKTGIPYSKIYNVLKKLREKEWVVIKQERPTIYYPVPPVEAWKSAKKKIMLELSKIEDTVVTEMQYLYESSVKSEFMLGSLYMIYGLRAIVNSIIEVLDKQCESSIMIAMPFEKILENGQLIKKIKWLSQSKNLKLLIDERNKNLVLRKFGKIKMSIRSRDKLFGGGVICNEVIFVVENKGSLVGLRSGLDFFVNLAKIYFEYLWKDSEIVLLS